MSETTPTQPEDAQPDVTEAELLALLKDVRDHWGKIEAHLLNLLAHRHGGRVDVGSEVPHFDCGRMDDLVIVSRLRRESTQKISWAPQMFGDHVRAEVMLYPLEGVRTLYCNSLDDGRLGLGIELADGTRLDERWDLIRKSADV